ncbi:hypothetical protein HKD37_05G013343 [Glycine soja]
MKASIMGKKTKEPIGSKEELDPCPSIPVKLEEFKEWCIPWMNLLIVKVMGKKVNYQMMMNRLNRDWARKGSIGIIDMPNEYYLDYNHALFVVPWMIVDHYIVVQKWRPFFSVEAKEARKLLLGFVFQDSLLSCIRKTSFGE